MLSETSMRKRVVRVSLRRTACISAKARTINKYLGPDFEVVASKGHVRDLPKSRFGIDIENGWIPTYRPLQDRKDVLTALKKQAAGAALIYLAPDDDHQHLGTSRSADLAIARHRQGLR